MLDGNFEKIVAAKTALAFRADIARIWNSAGTRERMVARGNLVKANAIVDALRRGDEAMAVGLIDRVTGAADLGLCLLRACETGYPKCTKQAKAEVGRSSHPVD